MSPIFASMSDEFDASQLRFVKVDTDLHEDQVEDFNIQGLPTFALISRGQLVASHEGALSKDALRSFVMQALRNQGR